MIELSLKISKTSSFNSVVSIEEMRNLLRPGILIMSFRREANDVSKSAP